MAKLANFPEIRKFLTNSNDPVRKMTYRQNEGYGLPNLVGEQRLIRYNEYKCCPNENIGANVVQKMVPIPTKRGFNSIARFVVLFT
jgi:hypothetical protein